MGWGEVHRVWKSEHLRWEILEPGYEHIRLMSYCSILPKVAPPCNHSTSRTLLLLSTVFFPLQFSISKTAQLWEFNSWFDNTSLSCKRSQSDTRWEIARGFGVFLGFFFFTPVSFLPVLVDSPGKSAGWLDLNLNCAITALSSSP